MRDPSSCHVLPGAKFLMSALCGLLMALSPAKGNEAAAGTDIPAASIAQAQRQHAQLERVVVAKLKFYAGHFPDIDFVVLDSAGDVAKNMRNLSRILGEDPDPLDYAHPADLRYDLLMAMLARIQLLLYADVGSATLFAPGKGALARRKQVCIVTMDPWELARDDRAATRHLLEIPAREFNEIPHSHYLDHVSHLRFALDHEIYHCLDTSLNGPIPKSQRRFWGKYQMLRNEDGADAFAVLMHKARAGGGTAYARWLAQVRGLMLLNNDPNHYTYPAIRAARQVDPGKLKRGDVRTCFRLATRIRNRVVGSYRDYLRYAAAAEQAMHVLGASPAMPQYSDVKVDHALAQALVAQTRRSYQALTGHPLPVAEN